MKKVKSICLLAVILIITAFIIEKSRIKIISENETRGIYVSYIEYTNHLSNKNTEDIKTEIKNMIKIIKEYNFNLVILQVRPFSDSIYNSKIFPTSWTVAGIEGDKLEIDILDYFIKIAHQNDIKVHAWVNPYRISNTTDISKISKEKLFYLMSRGLNEEQAKDLVHVKMASSVIGELVDAISKVKANGNGEITPEDQEENQPQ